MESLADEDEQDGDNIEPPSEREDRQSERSEHEQSEQPQPDHDEGVYYVEVVSFGFIHLEET